MTPFTMVLAYYDNPTMLRHHFEHWRALHEDIAPFLNVIVVDDGSPTRPAGGVLNGLEVEVLKCWIGSYQVWRMGVDVRWNQDACRNIGVREASTQWVLLTDMDHVVPEFTWRALMDGKLKKKNVYRFARVNAPALDPYKPHPNSWALTKRKYWDIGGYDEALAGNYGTDGDWLVRVRRHADIVDLPVPLIRYPREVIPDASTTTLARKSQQDKDNVNRIIHERNASGRAPLHFQFPCERVL